MRLLFRLCRIIVASCWIVGGGLRVNCNRANTSPFSYIAFLILGWLRHFGPEISVLFFSSLGILLCTVV